MLAVNRAGHSQLSAVPSGMVQLALEFPAQDRAMKFLAHGEATMLNRWPARRRTSAATMFAWQHRVYFGFDAMFSVLGTSNSFSSVMLS